MSIELVSALRFVVVSAFPGSPAQGDTVVLASDGKLYTYDGSSWVAAGGGSGSFTTYETTVDFGSVFLQSKTFDVTHSGANTAQRVVANVASSMPSGVDADELEMDPLIVSAHVVSTNTIRFLVSVVSPFSTITGQRKLYYTLG